MHVPGDVDLYGIHPHGPHPLQSVLPFAGVDSEVVDIACDIAVRAAVLEELVVAVVDLEAFRLRLDGCREKTQEECGQHEQQHS